jgi:hypothetical protein
MSTLASKVPKSSERSVPLLPWRKMALTALLAMLALLLVWEVWMRQLGLQAGDLDDGRAHWVVERRKVDQARRDSVVIVGDSRILYGTDLDRWEELTGERPIQLARVATNAGGFLHDLATDEHFAGLVVLGTAEEAYFNDYSDAPELLEYLRNQTPAQRIGHQIYTAASRHAAFLDSDYALFKMIEQHNWPERKGVSGPYSWVWKLSESFEDRQTYLWDRIERDTFLRTHLQTGWLHIFEGDVVKAETIAKVIARTKLDVERIRARGGEVVWIRPPSNGPLFQIEHRRFPREITWDPMMRETGSFGVHFLDYPPMQRLETPDWSHLSPSAALEFTDLYVGALLKNVAWLKQRTNRSTKDVGVPSN